MTSIKYVDNYGRLRSIKPIWEFILYYLFLSQMLSFGTPWPLSWVVGAFLIWIWASWNARKLQALGGKNTHRTLTDDELRLFPIVEQLREYFRLNAAPRVLVDVENPGLAAEVGGINRKNSVVVSAGMISEIGRSTPKAQAILAHEFAHLANLDGYLTPLLGIGRFMRFLLPINIGLLFFETMSLLNTIIGAILGYGGILLAEAMIQRALSRREFYADAAAANFIKDAEGFEEILKIEPITIFHPDPRDRLLALQGTSSPVLKPSPFVLIFGLFFSFTTFASGISMAVNLDDFYSEAVALLSLGVAAFILLYTVCIEAAKPWRGGRLLWKSINVEL